MWSGSDTNDSMSEMVCEQMGRENTLVNGGCPANFDTVLCWPNTAPNSTLVQSCFAQFNGISYDTTQNASRMCFPNGTWDQYSDYSACRELNPIDLPDVEITTTIYFVGYTISLLALLVAVYIFWKFKDLRCLRNTIHMNLMCSYILADFMWIFVYTLQGQLQTNKILCVFLIIQLHYYHLTNFFWMFVEGMYLYILVVRTFSGENIKPRLYLMIGWGGPIVFVLLWSFTKAFSSRAEEGLQHPHQIIELDEGVDLEEGGSGGDMLETCPWGPHPYDWIYQGPAIAVLLINVIFLCIIMWVLITKLRSANNVETQQYRKAAKALLILIPLLGITHVLVIVGPADGVSRQIHDSLRAALLSTQGFTVAIFYCFRNTEVKNTLRHHYNSWHTRRALSSRRLRYSSTASKECQPNNHNNQSGSGTESLNLYEAQNLFRPRPTSSTEFGAAGLLITIPLPDMARTNNRDEDDMHLRTDYFDG